MRTLVCTVVGIFAVILLIAITPKEQFESKGMALPSAHIRTPISPDSVVITRESLQENARPLGQVRAEIAFSGTLNLETRHQLFEKVKELAASLGANTVVITALVPGGISNIVTFVGTAFYIPSKAQGVKS